ncbi:hypothetical protein EG328_001702 [Venturia inaequalis]|uniref:Secreted protein n=1 Tax=Venturia inaequalis TaxID=5025 RepID=A0A8H3YRS3_VENIN|nr:hypothetical protein EG327_011607 [Venturia inaequalis]KAE9978082.1 hypothetical protein EG328_001702 [Venturia inaequalis]RDI76680.1 hypothetical protein Vi05172_g13335 [Venturia inaequalis]
MLHYSLIVCFFSAVAWAESHTERTATGFIVPRSINIQFSSTKSTTSAPIPAPSCLPESNHFDLRQNSPDTVHTESTVTCCLVKARNAAPTGSLFALDSENAERKVHDQIPMPVPTTLATVVR